MKSFPAAFNPSRNGSWEQEELFISAPCDSTANALMQEAEILTWAFHISFLGSFSVGKQISMGLGLGKGSLV